MQPLNKQEDRVTRVRANTHTTPAQAEGRVRAATHATPAQAEGRVTRV